jgi:hypothetical protein
MGSFAFKLEREDGSPADPPTLKAAVPKLACRRRDRVGGRAVAPGRGYTTQGGLRRRPGDGACGRDGLGSEPYRARERREYS